jgi:uncharacterized protein YjiS (DUF1127 family)
MGASRRGRQGLFALRFGGFGRPLLSGLMTWYDRARQRRALLGLDERMLKDIGLTRVDIDIECRKPFWRP